MKRIEHWNKHVELQRRSGLSQTKYCAENGLSVSSFGYWLQKLSKEGGTSKERFISLTSNGDKPLEIVIGKVVLRVPPGSDLSELRRVVEVLS